MAGFELRTSSIGSDCSANWATTTAQFRVLYDEVHFSIFSLKCVDGQKNVCEKEISPLDIFCSFRRIFLRSRWPPVRHSAIPPIKTWRMIDAAAAGAVAEPFVFTSDEH